MKGTNYYFYDFNFVIFRADSVNSITKSEFKKIKYDLKEEEITPIFASDTIINKKYSNFIKNFELKQYLEGNDSISDCICFEIDNGFVDIIKIIDVLKNYSFSKHIKFSWLKEINFIEKESQSYNNIIILNFYP